MFSIIKKIPLPMSGLMLALAATGNLLSSYGNVFRYFFGAAAFILMILIAAKAVILPGTIKEGFDNPVAASVLPTFSMGLMILSTYIKAFLPVIALGTWFFGLLLHILLLALFTKKYIPAFNIKKVFPSYFIVYVGIVSGSVTAPVFGLNSLGQYIFWFGFASYLILLPVILYRVLVVKEIPEAALPTVTILAAPASLCLAGYLNSFQEKNMTMIVFLGILSLVMLISVLIYMPKALKLKFYPSYSAFTFPFIISAIAVKGTYAFLLKTGNMPLWLKYPVYFIEILSICMVVYVSIRYLRYISSSREPLKQESPEKPKSC